MHLDPTIIPKIQSDMTRAVKHVLSGPVGGDYASDIEDVVQDSLIELLQYEAPGEQDPTVLANTIATRNALDYKQKQGRRSEIEADNAEEIVRNFSAGAQHMADDPLELLEAQDAFVRLNDLSPSLARVVDMYYVVGMTAKEIAAQEDTTEQAVYKRLERARTILNNRGQ